MGVLKMRNEQETEEEVVEEPEQKKEKPLLKKLLFALAIVTLGAISYIVYLQIISPIMLKRAENQKKSPHPLKMYEFERLTTNPAESEGRRFAVISLAAELEPKKSKEICKELENKALKIQDILIKIVSNKTVEDLETKKEELRQEILDKLNETLVAGKLKEIYFTEFVIQ
jgi:flagellar FliL protein